MEAQVAQWCSEILAHDEYLDCLLVDVVVSGRRKIEVYLDADTGITFERCQKISRMLEGMIEESGQFDEKYILEVSSPGPKRPMKFLRQYPKHAGRTLEIVLKDGSTRSGVLRSVTDGNITIEVLVKAQGKKKKKEKIQVNIPFREIDHAVVTYAF